MPPVSSKELLDIQAEYSVDSLWDKYSQHSSIIWPVWLNCWVFVYELSGCGFRSSSCHLIRKTIECRFTLKLVSDMTVTNSEMHCTDNYSQCSSIIWLPTKWLCVLIMLHTRFRVNPHSIVAWMLRNSLLEASAKSEI